MNLILRQKTRRGNIIDQINGHSPSEETQKSQISSPFDTYLVWRGWPADQHAECYEWSILNDHNEAPDGVEGRS